jgi:periplasmic divalent cation tolerance protein
MTGLLQVVTATETKEQGLSLAGEAVRGRLAASGQVHGPVTSAFWHLGEFGTSEEWSTVLLTTADKYPDLEAFILANHPWQNPQLIATAVVEAFAGNVEWAKKALAQPDYE